MEPFLNCPASKSTYREQACCDNPEGTNTKIQTYYPEWSASSNQPAKVPDACDLPVYVQCQFDVNETHYQQNFPFTSRNIAYIYAHGTGIIRGHELMVGTAFSPYTKSLEPVDFTNANSIPRNIYVQEYLPNSDSAVKFWNWYLDNYATNGMFINGEAITQSALIDSNARIVFSGMCASVGGPLIAKINSMFGNGVAELPAMLPDSFAFPQVSNPSGLVANTFESIAPQTPDGWTH